MSIRDRIKKLQDENLIPPASNFSETCILCGHYDCDCEDVLTPEEYAELVKKYQET